VTGDRDMLHASCVAMQGRAALLLGPSGTGKSALAIELLALGAALVADDATVLRREGGRLLASAPPGAPALIEARGVGLIPAPLAPETPLLLAVDLAQQVDERLPPRRAIRLLGVALPLLCAAPAAVVALCLRGGPPVDPDQATLPQ
jgi:HPr kinase/phosphorylase